MGLFTHYKSFVKIALAGAPATEGEGSGGSGGQGKTFNFYAERFSGGRVEFALAEASPAGRPGRWYRATRFRVGEITIETYAEKAKAQELKEALSAFYRDRSLKGQIQVTRTLVGDKLPNGDDRVEEIYLRCSIIEPPQFEDTDVTRDTEFVMLTLRLQPEGKIVKVNGVEVENYDANAKIDGSPFVNP